MRNPLTHLRRRARTPWATADSQEPEYLAFQPGGARTDFAQPVANGGYAWWYIDGLSNDGRSCFTVIAFIGSVFSPYYARARRKNGQNVAAEQFAAINAVVYSDKGSKRWAMTERNAKALSRTETSFTLGPSELRWDEQRLRINIDERCAPFGQALRGSIVVDCEAPGREGFSLHTNGAHWWQPLAAKSHVSVAFERPEQNWEGLAYVDHNQGTNMLEQDFAYWSWSREHSQEKHSQGTDIDYELWQRDGTHRLASVRIDERGQMANTRKDPRQQLPDTGWGIERVSRRTGASVCRTLEDTPFYARSTLSNSSGDFSGKEGRAQPNIVCEHLNLQRFGSRWVQCLLPFRMPRRG